MVESDDAGKTWIQHPAPLDDVLAVEWDREGDEWLKHLYDAIAGLAPLTARVHREQGPTQSIPYPHIMCSPESPVLRSRLAIIRLRQGIVVAIEGDGEPSIDQIQPWVTAVQTAGERLGHSHTEFAWGAIVGVSPEWDGRHVNLEVLETPASVGPLRLRPGGVFVQERTPPRFPSLNGFGAHETWPLIVEGASSGYSWDAASPPASRDLHRLCALLSIVWEQCWVLREGPQPSTLGEIHIPEKVPPDAWFGPIDDNRPPPHPLRVPDWLDSAWTLLDGDSDLAHAVAGHYEGLQLLRDHPSFALIAFVGSIESIGAKLFGLRRCAQCQADTGYARRFRKALRLVRSRRDAENLFAAYDRRSKTAHAGHLHGAEPLFGVPDFSRALSADPMQHFAWGLARRMGNVSRDLLVRALTGDLPAPESGQNQSDE